MNTLTEWLSKQLLDRGWSQRELGRRAGVSGAMVSEVVNGRPPGWEFCAAIAKPLGKTPVEMFRLAGLLPASIGTVDDLDGEESEIIRVWRGLPEADKEYLLRLVRMLDEEIRKDEEGGGRRK